jgi:hypothetical protein
MLLQKKGHITGAEELLLASLTEFYKDQFNQEKLYNCIVLKKNNICLRLLDWFVTNYSKKSNVVYEINRGNKIILFDVYKSYKTYLRSYPKKLFDPFCRGSTILLENINGGTDNLETAICQMQFFKWAIQNLIIEYVQDNYKVIYDDMIANGSKINGGNNAIRKKKKQLSESVYKSICPQYGNFTISFD